MADLSFPQIGAPQIAPAKNQGGLAALLGYDSGTLSLVSLDPAGTRRSKIWDISINLHCSIIGTCLTAAELRRFFVKLGDTDAKTATDHELHSRGVRTAAQRDNAAKLLNKALDKRQADAVRALWARARDEGDIPGAYWAVLTHPTIDRFVISEVFGEVHMLSHMVGSANRVDLARLSQLERELGKRDDTIARQEIRLKTAAGERGELFRRIDKLEADLIRAQALEAIAPQADGDEAEALRRKLDDEKARSTALSARLQEAEALLEVARKSAAELEARDGELQGELSALEQELGEDDGDVAIAAGRLDGRTLLYVGGRPGQVEQLKAIAERKGGALLAHDGGIEDNTGRLRGLVSQAEIAFFPVDCISHHAAGQLKRLCREAGKPFVPLRSASAASFLAAIGRNALFAVGAEAAE